MWMRFKRWALCKLSAKWIGYLAVDADTNCTQCGKAITRGDIVVPWHDHSGLTFGDIFEHKMRPATKFMHADPYTCIRLLMAARDIDRITQ